MIIKPCTLSLSFFLALCVPKPFPALFTRANGIKCWKLKTRKCIIDNNKNNNKKTERKVNYNMPNV